MNAWQVTAAIEGALRELLSLQSSQVGQMLEAARDGLGYMPSRTDAQERRMLRACGKIGPLRYCTAQEVAVLLARYGPDSTLALVDEALDDDRRLRQTVLRQFKGWRYVGQRTGLPASTAKVRVRAARAKVREALRP